MPWPLNYVQDYLDERWPFLAVIVTVTIAVFTLTRIILRESEVARKKLGSLIGGDEGAYDKYFSILKGSLDATSIIFYDNRMEAAVRRPLIHIYSTFLSIALGLTVVLFFIGWATGGSGAVGQAKVIIPDYGVPSRMLLAIGWACLGYFCWKTVRHHPRIDRRAQGLLAAVGISVRPKFVTALLGATFVFCSQWISRDRSFAVPEPQIVWLQLSLAALAFAAIFWTKGKHFVAFSHVTAACYGLALGVPILIGVPLAVAITTIAALKGAEIRGRLPSRVPLLASTTIIPSLMLVHYYLLPQQFQRSEFANLSLAAMACLPLLFIMMNVTLQSSTHWLLAIVYSALSFLPFWLPVSFSSMQISDAVAYAIVIFWFVIPMLNAIWDSMSWWATWKLLTHLRSALLRISESESDKALSFEHFRATVRRFVVLFGHVAVNFTISGVIFCLTFFTVITALSIANQLIQPIRPEYMIDVNGLLEAVKLQPSSGDGLWIITMVFITLIPALTHLIVVLLTFLVMAIAPKYVVKAWRDLLKEDHKTINRAEKICSFYTALSVFFVFLIIFGAWELYWSFGSKYRIGDLLGWIGQFALDVAQYLRTILSIVF